MYYEEAEVKTYVRNYKNKKVPYNQIYLGENSKFNKNPEEPDKVAVINISDFKDLIKENKTIYSNESKDEYNKILEEKVQLEKELNEFKATIESLTSEKLELQQDLLTEKDKHEKLINETNSKIDVANNNVIEAKEKIEELQKEHKEETSELNSKLNNEKDFSKALLVAINDLNKRNFISRLINKEPFSVKQVLELKPKELDVKDISKD